MACKKPVLIKYSYLTGLVITIRKKTFITGTYALLFAAMIFHGTYNILVQSDRFLGLGIIIPLLVFAPFSIYLYRSEKTTGEVK